tara:strand:- start:51 stop:632 length:582 start_codon:yes stop_codon:yes gene_type:complete
MDYFIHETAIVDENVSIGKDSKIWHWTHISSNASIGSNCSLGQNVYVASEVRIGDNCKIQNNVSVYKGVTLKDGVFCGPSMVFTNVINPRSEVERKDEFMNTIVEKGATMGANCTIVCGNNIGEYSFVAAGAVVTSSTKPFSLNVGVPARQVGWVSKRGDIIDLPLSGNGEHICKKDNAVYKLINNNLVVNKL